MELGPVKHILLYEYLVVVVFFAIPIDDVAFITNQLAIFTKGCHLDDVRCHRGLGFD